MSSLLGSLVNLDYRGNQNAVPTHSVSYFYSNVLFKYYRSILYVQCTHEYSGKEFSHHELNRRSENFFRKFLAHFLSLKTGGFLLIWLTAIVLAPNHKLWIWTHWYPPKSIKFCREFPEVILTWPTWRTRRDIWHFRPPFWRNSRLFFYTLIQFRW